MPLLFWGSIRVKFQNSEFRGNPKFQCPKTFWIGMVEFDIWTFVIDLAFELWHLNLNVT